MTFLGYRDVVCGPVTHWKHGGIVGVFGYGGGIIGRYCDQPEMFPGVAHFHTVRVNQPSSKYYTTKFLRDLCDLWEKHGSGLTNMHGSTGDIVFLGTTTEHLEPLFFEMTHELQSGPRWLGLQPANPGVLSRAVPLRVRLL